MGNTLENNVIDIDLSALRKKRIRINGICPIWAL